MIEPLNELYAVAAVSFPENTVHMSFHRIDADV